eukprot:GFUD01033658.1.p1 GENE.GFUD01033658.1~~GFUD01033658.1.p1  ORF type:complete len:614 (+),score=127.80 GFUD01033658.1:36-1877(+)
MILTNHGKHLSDAFSSMCGVFSEIKVFTSNGTEVSLNKNLLQLFSPFLRGILADIPENSALIIPDSSAFAISQISKIFSSGISGVGIISYKDINEIVETGKFFGFDLSHISYEKVDMSDNVDPSLTLEESAAIEESFPEKLLKTISNNISKVSESNQTNYSQKEGFKNTNDIKNEKEARVKDEPSDNLLSFCEGIKGLIGKSLGIETDSRVNEVSTFEPLINPDNIKLETPEENSEEYFEEVSDSEQCDLVPNHEEFQTSSAPSPLSSSQVHAAGPFNTMYQPMLMPISIPMVPSVYQHPFTLETPPPDLFPAYPHQNMDQSLFHHPPTTTNYVRQDEHPQKKIRHHFTCNSCKVYTNRHAEHFRKHVSACKRLNPKAMKLDCRICPFTSKNPVKYHKHIRDKHNELVSACDDCEFTTFYESQLRKHNSMYHNGEVFSCRKCDYEGPHLKALQQHISDKHEKTTKSDQQSRSINTSWRKEIGFGPDDKFTCNFWNFVGKGQCRMEDGHKDAGRVKVSRHHVCALCFRNTGQKKPHPAVSCRMFQMPEKEKGVASHQAGETGPSMADLGFTRGLSREERCSSREQEYSAREEGYSARKEGYSAREEGEVDSDMD